MPDFEFTLPDGSIQPITNAPSRAEAGNRVRAIIAREFPEEFRQWQESRPLTPFGASFGQGMRSTAGNAVSGIGAAAEQITGSDLGLRGAGRSISGQPEDPNAPDVSLTRNIGSLSEFGSELMRSPGAAIGQAAGQGLGSLAALVPVIGAGAAAGAALPVAGITAGVGATAATLGASIFGSIGETEQTLLQEGVDPTTARRLATTLGAGIGAVEGAGPLALLRGITGRTIRNEAVGNLTEIAQRGIVNATARGVAHGAVVEGASEFGGVAARQAVAAGATGNLNLVNRLDHAAFEGVVGGLAGGGVGGVTGSMNPGRAQNILDQQAAANPPPVPPAPPVEPIDYNAPLAGPNIPEGTVPLVPMPEPFTDIQAARAWLDAPDAEIARRVHGPFPTEEAELQYANSLLQYENNVENNQRRANAIIRFVGADAILEPEDGVIDRKPQAGTLISYLSQAAANGEIDLLNFSARDVANLALNPLGVPATTENTRYVAQQLQALAKDDLIEATGKGTYSITNRDTSGLAFKVAQKQGPNPNLEPPVVPGTAATGENALTRTNRIQEAAQTFSKADSDSIVDLILTKPKLGKAAFTNILADAQKPGISYRTLQKMFRDRGLILEDRQATALFKRGQELGLISRTNQIVGYDPNKKVSTPPLAEAATVAPPQEPVSVNQVRMQETVAPQENNVAPEQEAATTPEAVAPAAQENIPTPPTEATPAVAQPTAQVVKTPIPPATEAAAAASSPSGQSTAAAPVAPSTPVLPVPPINTLPPTPAAAAPIIKKATQRFITGFLKWFGSPIMGLGRAEPALAPASAVSQYVMDHKSEINIDLEGRIVSFTKLPDASKIKVTRRWAEMSRAKKVGDMSDLNAEEQAALKDLIAGGQRAFDWMVEAYTMDNFRPSASSTPAEVARLNAFWQKNEGKHLWEIPAAELKAASPKGFQEMQALQKLRNPAYMPMIADGTHFVAAYNTNFKGERTGPPIRLVPYTPLTRPQKLNGFADPEAAAIQQLQNEYSGNKKVYIMQQGQQFTSNSEANRVRNQGDFISEYLTKLRQLPSVSSSNEAQQLLGRMQKELDVAQMDRIFRPNQNIMEPLNALNEASYVTDMVPRYFLGVSNIAARRITQEPFNAAIKDLHESDKDYLRAHRDYSTTPTEAFSTLRTLAFYTLLGGALDTAFINLLQPFQITGPMLVRDGANILTLNKEMGSIYGTLTKAFGHAALRGKNIVESVTNLLTDPAEKAAYTRALKTGVLQPLFTNESRGQVNANSLQKMGFQNASGKAKALNWLAKVLGTFQQQSEQTNRAVAFLTAYRLAAKDPSLIARANKLDNFQLKDAYDYAALKTSQTNFNTTKEDRALIQRFTPLAEPATQFMSYPLKTAELMVQQARLAMKGIKGADAETAKAGVIGLLAMVAPIVALGGVFALPGADSLKELLELMVKEVWGSTANFEADMRRASGGGFGIEALINGVPAAAGVASLRRRVSIDPVPFNDIAGASALQFLGPSASLLESTFRFYNYLKLGDYWNAAATAPFMPRSIGNLIRGADLQFGTGEIRSGRGNTLMSPDQIQAIDKDNLVPAGVRAMIGFQSPRIMEARDWFGRHEELRRLNQVATERAANEISGYMVAARRAEAAGNPDEGARQTERARQALGRVMERNREFIENGQQERVINLTTSALQRRAIQDYYGRSSEQMVTQGVPKPARQRALEEFYLYNPHVPRPQPPQ